MLSEEEKEAIEILENEKSNLYVLTQTKVTTCTLEQAKAKRKAINTVLNLINRLQNENEEKNKIIKLFEHECRKFKAFCRRVRKDGHDIDLFNQGQEHKCNQFLNLINGESHWDYEGKYFDETDKEIKKLSKEE